MAGGIMIHIDGDTNVQRRNGLNTHLLNRSQLGCMTKLTRTGTLDMSNRKPYRSKALKKQAQKNAQKCDDGTFRSTTPVLYHKSSNN